MDADIRRLVKTDLNLLVILHVLYQERSVSLAAEKLFVTQSAVSKSLARLRELFDDPLFTRSGSGLTPSPFLQVLAPELAAILTRIGDLLEPVDFHPATFKGELRVAFTETIELLLMPWLLAYLQRNAPGMLVISRHYDSAILQGLANGEIDFAIGLEYVSYPSEYRVEPILQSHPALFGRHGHPLGKGQLVFGDVVAYPRINLKLPDEGLTEYFQEIYGNRSEAALWPVGFETESLLTALSVVRTTDSLLAAPDVLSQIILAASDLEMFNLAEARSLAINFVLVSHRRTEHSAMHQWMASVLLAIGQQVIAGK